MSVKLPLISVIMNCHNGAKYLNDAVLSLKNQTYKNWELIFFDNFSNDKSREIIKGFKNKKIRYFFSKKKLKLYHARNLAVKKARGEFVSFLDSDDKWHKNKLKLQIKFFKKNKDINFVYSNYFTFYEKDKITKIFFKNKLPSGLISQKLLDKYVVGILTVMIRKSILKKEKFNRDFEIIGDFDLFFNLSKKYRVGCIQKPLALYRRHSDNYSKKINLYLRELNKWLSINEKGLKIDGYDLTKFKFFLFKLKLKNFLSYIGKY